LPIAIYPSGNYIASTGFAVLRAVEGNDSRYILYSILTDLVAQQIESYAVGSNYPAINSSDVRRLQIPAFAPREQRRIAEILSTLDETIEHTDALIAKYHQIKAGLMHDLLTCGVTPDGHLRPPCTEAPQLYKKSHLGWIPKQWDLKAYSEICEMITVGIVIRPTQYYASEGVPAFRSANIRESGIDMIDLVFISPEANRVLTKSQLRAGDILSVRTGYPGTSAVVTEDHAGMNCIDLLISRPAGGFRPDFLANWINSSFGRDQVLRKQGGLAQQHFNVGELRNILVAAPAVAEQDAILRRLKAISSMLTTERELAGKLRYQKRGLMHDLLTGRAR
jgi:type I restriction enzyme S subunit